MDLSVYKKLNLDHQPVGVKLMFNKPDGVDPINKSMALCELLKEALNSRQPFYFTKEHENCYGKAALGMVSGPPPIAAGSGQLGYRMGIFQDARANARIYKQNYILEKGSVNYVVLSPLDRIEFDPDLLILMAKPDQAEVVLRATTYSTGDIFASRQAIVLGCSWLFVYPYITGKFNYNITGLGFGMRGRHVFESGWFLIAIPFNWIPVITRNLNEMDFVPEAYTLGKEKFLQKEWGVIADINREAQNPLGK